MKGLSSLAAICAALLFVSVCVGLMTAGPAIAQGGGAGNKDVRVINTAAEAIPTTITNVPAVQVNSIPAVQVSSLPAVQVSSLPAVQIDGSTPVPTRGRDTQVLVDPHFVNIPAGDARLQVFDCAAFEKVRVIVQRNGAGTFRIGVFSGFERIRIVDDLVEVYTEVFEVPGTQMIVSVENLGAAAASVKVAAYGK